MPTHSSPFRVLDYGQLQIQIQIAQVTPEALREHWDGETARIRELLRGPPREFHKAIVILDSSVALMPPPGARTVQAEWLKENRELLKQVTHTVVYVVPNPLLRAFIAGVMALVPLPVPMRVHPNLQSAIDWGVEEAAVLGGEVSPELREFGAGVVDRDRLAASASSLGSA